MAKKDAEQAQLRETVEQHFEKVIIASAMTPLEDPHDEDCKWGLPTIFWGLSGIGKSERINAAAKSINLQPCEIIYPGTRQPEDFSGALVPFNGGTRVECTLGAVRNLISAKRGLLFLDEMSCAVPAVQGAMLSMVNERRVGDDKLPNSVRIMGAANPPEYAAGGWALEAPMSNRMAHFFVGPPAVQDWVEWLLMQQSQPTFSIEDAENTVRARWADEWAFVSGLLSSFMQSNTQHLHKQPKPDHPDAGYAWPSPRTWYMAARAVAAIRCLRMGEQLEQLFVEGCVGPGPANEWAEFRAKADLPDPRSALTKGWKIDTNRLDRTLAVYSSMVSLVTGTRDKDEKLELAAHCWDRLQELINSQLSDIALMPAVVLVRNNLGRKASPKLKEKCEPVLFHFGQDGLARFIDQ